MPLPTLAKLVVLVLALGGNDTALADLLKPNRFRPMVTHVLRQHTTLPQIEKNVHKPLARFSRSLA